MTAYVFKLAYLLAEETGKAEYYQIRRTADLNLKPETRSWLVEMWQYHENRRVTIARLLSNAGEMAGVYF